MKAATARLGKFIPVASAAWLGVLLVFASAAFAQTSADSTAQSRLAAVQPFLDDAQRALKGANARNRGGFVEKARTDIAQVIADVKDASDYLAAHPAANTLASGPTPAESADLQPEHFQSEGSFPALKQAIADLNQALDQLVNNPAANYHGPVLGDLGGIRKKILADIVQTADDISSAENFAQAGAPAAPASTRGGARAGRGARNAEASGRGARAGRAAAIPANRPLTAEELKALVIVEGDYSRGSGFVAKLHDQYFIVTNAHVLTGNKKFTMTGLDGVKYPLTGGLFVSIDRDVAILKIPSDLAPNYLEVLDDPVAQTKPNDAVTVPGNSEGAGVALQIPGKLIGVGPALVEVDAKFVAGNSGSPIIHRATGKVIGMATYVETFSQDQVKQAAQMQEIRWFGLRLDNIATNQWESIDWARFSDDGLRLRKLENLTHLMIAFLENQKLPNIDDDKVTQAVAAMQANMLSAQKRRDSKAYLSAVQTFMQTLQHLGENYAGDLANRSLYSYHASELKHQQDLLVQINKAFSAANTEIGTFKNTL